MHRLRPGVRLRSCYVVSAPAAPRQPTGLPRPVSSVRQATTAGGATGAALPVRLADATPGRQRLRPGGDRCPGARRRRPATPASAPADARPPRVAAVPGPMACQSDDDCPDETSATNSGVCQVDPDPHQHPLPVLPGGQLPRGARAVLVQARPHGLHGGRAVLLALLVAQEPHARGGAALLALRRLRRPLTATVIVPGLPISWSRQPGAQLVRRLAAVLCFDQVRLGGTVAGSFEIADPDTRARSARWSSSTGGSASPTSAADFCFRCSRSVALRRLAFTFALPLNFYWRNKDDKHLLAMPCSTGTRKEQQLALFAARLPHARTAPSTTARWSGCTGSGRNARRRPGYDVLFPLLWSFHVAATSHTTVAGPLVHLRRKAWSSNGASRLWWSGGDTARAWLSALLLPFFYWQRSSTATSRSG